MKREKTVYRYLLIAYLCFRENLLYMVFKSKIFGSDGYFTYFHTPWTRHCNKVEYINSIVKKWTNKKMIISMLGLSLWKLAKIQAINEYRIWNFYSYGLSHRQYQYRHQKLNPIIEISFKKNQSHIFPCTYFFLNQLLAREIERRLLFKRRQLRPSDKL